MFALQVHSLGSALPSNPSPRSTTKPMATSTLTSSLAASGVTCTLTHAHASSPRSRRTALHREALLSLSWSQCISYSPMWLVTLTLVCPPSAQSLELG